MKKIFLFIGIFTCSVFANTDIDLDWVIDSQDTCPRVYSRSINWCPTLIPVVAMNKLDVCRQSLYQRWLWIVILSPICKIGDKNCPKIQSIKGAQSCDPLFPVILDSVGSILFRWGMYVLDYIK